MKRRSIKSLNLNKKSISSLNLLEVAGGLASSHPSARTACLSCTRSSCDPGGDCKITLAEETCAQQNQSPKRG